MKIKNNLFTASNLPKLGYLLAFVFILGCGGGGSGGTASSPIASGDTASSENSDTDSNTGAGSGDPASSENSDTDSNTGAGSGDTASNENSDTDSNTGAGSGDTASSENSDTGSSTSSVDAFNAELQKISALTQTEVKLQNLVTLNLELVEESAGSGKFYLKAKEPVAANIYNIPHEAGQQDLLLSAGVINTVSIETDVEGEFEISLYNSNFDGDAQTLKADANIQFNLYSEPTTAQSYASHLSYPIIISGKVSGTGADIIKFHVLSGPIFQVKISENLVSQDLVFHSNVEKYKLNGAKFDISGGGVRLSNLRPLYIANDTSTARKLTFNIFGKKTLQIWDQYGKDLYELSNQDSTGFSGGSYTFNLAPNQGEFLSFGHYSSSLPLAENVDAKIEIETSGESPVSIDLFNLFSSYHYNS